MNKQQRSTNESYEPREPNSPATERPQREQPRIYVASLSDYNSGNLHGRWIDAAQDAGDLHTAISEDARCIARTLCRGVGYPRLRRIRPTASRRVRIV